MDSKSSSLIAWIFIICGIAIRYYLQFVSWTFHGDEINLGINIVQKSFSELLLPLERGQSAPPLFLILEKSLSFFGKPEYSLKVLPFISSCFALLLFYRIIKYKKESLYLLALGFLCFSPFVISNSLTLKQYSLDLTLLLLGFILTWKKTNAKILISFSFFFCLCSNIGSFFCLSAILLKLFKEGRKKFETIDAKPMLALATGPLIYSIYFLFFINQEGSDQLREYMQNYWDEAFIPLNSEIFYWSLSRIKGVGYYFLTSYLVIDIILLGIIFIGLLSMLYEEEKNDLIYIIQQNYLLIVFIHITLSSLKIYPFSDRLYLYLAPFVYLSLVKGLIICSQYLSSKLSFMKIRSLYYSSYSILILLIIQIPHKDNDIPGVVKSEKTGISDIYLTQKSHKSITEWLELIENREVQAFLNNSKILNTGVIPEKNSLIISRQQRKFGHQNKTSEPEEDIQFLLQQNRIKLFKTMNGYKTYIVTR